MQRVAMCFGVMRHLVGYCFAAALLLSGPCSASVIRADTPSMGWFGYGVYGSLSNSTVLIDGKTVTAQFIGNRWTGNGGYTYWVGFDNQGLGVVSPGWTNYGWSFDWYDINSDSSHLESLLVVFNESVQVDTIQLGRAWPNTVYRLKLWSKEGYATFQDLDTGWWGQSSFVIDKPFESGIKQFELFPRDGGAKTLRLSSIDISPLPISHFYLQSNGGASGDMNQEVSFTVTACGNASCSFGYYKGATVVLNIAGYGTRTITIPAGSTSASFTWTPTSAGAVAFSYNTSTPYYRGAGAPLVCGFPSCVYNSLQTLDHLEVFTSSYNNVNCNPVYFTIKACGNASCSIPYTRGLSGYFYVAGQTGWTNYPGGWSFSIPEGNATSTVSAQLAATGNAWFGVYSLSAGTKGSPYLTCGSNTSNGTNQCGVNMVSSGLIMDVPHHRSGVSKVVALRAVRASDNASVCVPAFTGVKNVNFRCGYANPGSGTLPVLINGVGTNASGNAAAACDGGGRTMSLTFDGTGTSYLGVQYNDVGQVNLTATYTGSGNDAGLSLSVSDSFIVAPIGYWVTHPTAPIKAGQPFSVAVAAFNSAGSVTPNYGRESAPQVPVVSLLRAKPSGGAAVNGTFNLGVVGAASNGTFTFTGLSWTEVGRAELTARLGNGSYLGSGYSVYKTSTSAAWYYCADAGYSCTLPAGSNTYTMSFDAGGSNYTYKHGVPGGTVFSCTAGNFPLDPYPGAYKSCWYVADTGADTNAGGALTFQPNHFVFNSLTPGCSGSFSYSGQPFGAVLRAVNAAGNTTVNYDGTPNTSPNFAKMLTLSATTNGGTGTLSNSTVAASQFSAGVATVAYNATSGPAFTFANKLTAPAAVGIRATDADGVTSSSDSSLPVRSGRLRVSNSFGTDKSPREVPIQSQYWSGDAWVVNSQDGCTVIPSASVVRTNYRDNKGAASAAWTTAPTAPVTLVGGNGVLQLSAPTPSGFTGSVDIALNLGASTVAQSCLSSHPASVGANVPWLRSRNGSTGSCVGLTTFDRDPSALITFGVFKPETSRIISVRDIF